MNFKQSEYQKCTILAAIFFFSCFLHYFSLRPLWLDENYVLDNILNLTPWELFGPLTPNQTFPRVHLIIIQFLSSFFDYHVLALRGISLVAMLSAFCIWFRLYKCNLEKPWLLFFVLLAFVSSYRINYYSAELKPYAMDVFVVALHALYIQYQSQFTDKPPTKWLVWGAVLMPGFLFFSYAALFVFWIVSYNFILLAKRNKQLVPVLCAGIGSALLCFLTVYTVDIRGSVTEVTVNYWQGQFICTENVSCFFDTFGDGLKKLVAYWNGTEKFHRRGAVIFIPFFIFSIFYYGFGKWKSDRFAIFSVDSLAWILLLELIVLGVLHKYPFSGSRLTLFFAPFVFYMIVKGIDHLKRPQLLRKVFIAYFVAYYGFCLFNTLLTLMQNDLLIPYS